MRLKQVLLSTVLGVGLLIANPSSARADPVSAFLITAAGFSVTAASVAATTTFLINAGLSLAVSIGTKMLSKGQSAQERQASVATLSLGEGPREAVLGQTITAGWLIDAFNFGGRYGTDTVTRCVGLADHLIDGIIGFYVGETYHPWVGEGLQAAFSNKLSFHFRNAASAGHTPPAHVMTNGGWATTDRLCGVAHIWIDTHGDDKVWTQGHPVFRFVLRGLRAYDPRKDAALGYTGANPHVWENPATHAFTRNAMVLRYALQRGIYAEGHQGEAQHLLVGRGLTAEEAPPERIIAAANLCDEVVSGGPRYQADGVIRSTDAFITVEEMFAAATAGVIVQHEGGVEVEPGQAKAAVVTISDGDLVVGEPVQFSDFLPDTDGGRINSVVPNFPDPGQNWAARSGPVRRDQADIEADGGPRELTLPLLLVTTPNQADRCAEITRRVGRMERRASIVLPPEYAGLEEGDWIAWQSDRYHDGATVRYRIEGWSLDASWKMRLQLREIAASGYGVAVPLPDLIAPPGSPFAPGALTLEGVAIEPLALDGTIAGASSSPIPALLFSWDIPVDPAVVAIRAEIRKVGNNDVAVTRTEDVNRASDADPEKGSMLVTNGVPPASAVEGRLVPITGAGRAVFDPAWLSVTTLGDAIPPAPTALDVESVLFPADALGRQQAVILANWTGVPPEVAPDLAGYDTEYTETDQPPVTRQVVGTSDKWQQVRAGVTYSVRVRSRGKNGAVSAWTLPSLATGQGDVIIADNTTHVGVVPVGVLLGQVDAAQQAANTALTNLDAVPGQIDAAVETLRAATELADANLNIAQGLLQGALNTLDGELDAATQTLQGGLDTLNGELDTATQALQGGLDTLDAAYDQIAVNLNDPATGLNYRVGQAETVGNNAAQRVGVVEVALNTPETGALARIGSLETATFDPETGLSTAQRVDSLETASGLIEANVAALQTATSNLALGKADASRVATLEARARGGNDQPDSTFAAFTALGIGYTSASSSGTYTLTMNNPDYSSATQNVMEIHDTSGQATGVIDVYGPWIPSKPGVRYEYAAAIAPHRARAELYMSFADAYYAIAGGAPLVAGGTNGGGFAAENMARVGAISEASPTNTAYRRLVIRLARTGEGDPYLFVKQPQTAEATAQQTQLSPYTEGPTVDIAARVQSVETATANLQTGKAAATRVDLLESQVQNATSGLLQRATSLESRTTAVETGKAATTRVDALEATVNTAGTGLSSRVASLAQATADLQTNKASASALALLEARSQSTPNILINGDFANGDTGWATSDGSAISAIYSSAIGNYVFVNTGVFCVSETYLAAPGRVISLSADGQGAGPNDLVYAEWIPSLQTAASVRVSDNPSWSVRKYGNSQSAAPAGTTGWRAVIFSGSAPSAVSRIKVNDGAVATAWSDEATDYEVQARIRTVETATTDGSFAEAERLDEIAAAVETPGTGLLSRVAGLTQANTDLLAGRASATALNQLLAQIDAPSTGILASLGTLFQTTADLQANKASATAVTALEARSQSTPNIFVNGDFSDGIDGWNVIFGTPIQPNYSPSIGSYGYLNANSAAVSDTYPAVPGQKISLSADGQGAGPNDFIYVEWVPSLQGAASVQVSSNPSWNVRKYGNALSVAPAGTTGWRVVAVAGASYFELTRIKVNDGPIATVWSVEATDYAAQARIRTVETATTDGRFSAASRSTALETTVNTPGTGLSAKVGDLLTATSDLATIRANALRAVFLEARAQVRTNLIVNSTGSQGLRGWTQIFGDKLVLASPTAATGANFNYTAPFAAGAGSGVGIFTAQQSVVQGSVYSFQAELRAGTSLVGQVRAYIAWVRSDGSVSDYTVLTANVASAAWTRLLAENITPPADAVSWLASVDATGSWGTGNAFGWRRLKMEIGPVCTTWTDEGTDSDVGGRVGLVETATADLQSGKADATRVLALEAGSSGTASLAINPHFAAWPNTVPESWSIWSQPATLSKIARDGGGGNVMRQSCSAGTDAGLQQNSGNNAAFSSQKAGWYVLTADVKLVSGSLIGAGIHSSLAAPTQAGYLNLSIAPDATGAVVGAGAVGNRYYFQLLQYHDGVGPLILYQMTNWTGGFGNAAKTLDWYEASIRPATPSEIALQQAVGSNHASLSARLGSVDTAVTNLQSGKADASRVTSLEARAGGGNLLKRSQFTSVASGYAPWTIQGNLTGTGGLWTNEDYAPAGERPLVFHQTNAAAGYSDFVSELVPWSATKRIVASVYSGAHRCTLTLFIGCLDVNGNVIAYVNPPQTAINAGALQGGKTLDSFKRLVAFFGPPAGTAFVHLLLRKEGTYAGSSDSYGFWLRAMLSEATATQTEAPPWVPVSSEARLTTQELASADLYGRTQARWTIGATVPGATAFIEAQAETSPGQPPTSNVAIGARVISVLNPADGAWKEALRVSNGNVTLSGGLQAGAFIRLGNGQGWPVALRAADFNATDGGVVSFGTDLGNLPSLSFGMNNLAPLNAGETYDVRAVGLSPTGFTLVAKINVPGTPTVYSVTTSEAQNQPVAQSRWARKEGVPQSSDGTYRIQASGTNNHSFTGLGSGPISVDDEDFQYNSVDVYVWNGTAWSLRTQLSAFSSVNKRGFAQGQYYNGPAPFTIDETVTLGDGVEIVALAHSQTGSNQAVSTFTLLGWTAAGTAAGVRSATPGGTTTKITVRPQ